VGDKINIRGPKGKFIYNKNGRMTNLVTKTTI